MSNQKYYNNLSFVLSSLDVAVTVIFFLNGHAVWGAISLAFVALSTFAMQIFSFCWHVTDGTMTVQNFMMHAFFLAPLHRLHVLFLLFHIFIR